MSTYIVHVDYHNNHVLYTGSSVCWMDFLLHAKMSVTATHTAPGPVLRCEGSRSAAVRLEHFSGIRLLPNWWPQQVRAARMVVVRRELFPTVLWHCINRAVKVNGHYLLYTCVCCCRLELVLTTLKNMFEQQRDSGDSLLVAQVSSNWVQLYHSCIMTSICSTCTHVWLLWCLHVG